MMVTIGRAARFQSRSERERLLAGMVPDGAAAARNSVCRCSGRPALVRWKAGRHKEYPSIAELHRVPIKAETGFVDNYEADCHTTRRVGESGEAGLPNVQTAPTQRLLAGSSA